MKLVFDRADLQRWVDEARLANTTYYKTRRALWEDLLGVLEKGPQAPTGDQRWLRQTTFVAIKLFLTSRNEQLNDASRLGFETQLASLDDWLQGHASRVEVTRPGTGEELL